MKMTKNDNQCQLNIDIFSIVKVFIKNEKEKTRLIVNCFKEKIIFLYSNCN